MKRKHEQNEGQLCPARLHRVSIVCPMVVWINPSHINPNNKQTNEQQPSFLVVFWLCFAYGEHKLGSSLSVFQNNGGNIKGPVLPEEQLNFSVLQNCKLFKEKMHFNKRYNFRLTLCLSILIIWFLFWKFLMKFPQILWIIFFYHFPLNWI